MWVIYPDWTDEIRPMYRVGYHSPKDGHLVVLCETESLWIAVQRVNYLNHGGELIRDLF